MMQTQTSPATHETLKGAVERVTFHSEETGFCVLRVKVPGHVDFVTVVSNSAAIQAGELVECQGFWQNDKQHGLQFKALHLKTIAPNTLEGIERYLASGMIRGIGPAYAKRLINVFKENVFTIIEKQPDRLHEVEGIGQRRKAQIVQAWAQQRTVRDIMLFLHSHGVGTSRAVRIYKTYGEKAIDNIKENPYCLANDIHGIGFKTADQLARKMGIAPDAMVRIRAGVTYCLQEHTAKGHCGIESTLYIALSAKTLEVDSNLIASAIDDEVKTNRITEVMIEETRCYFLTSLYLSENSIATQCQRLQEGSTAWHNIDADKAIEWVQHKNQITLSASQIDAVKLALKNKVMIITGGPGVGKTTIVNSIIQIIRAKRVEILLTAPTGRAAKRLSESTGMEAKTIHRLLEFDPKSYAFKRNADFPLRTDLVIIDESSMVDVPLMNQLLRAIPLHAGVLFVGDVDQLPSVGPGMVLKYLIDSKALVTARLTEIFRQAATSKIITNAHRINQGLMPDIENAQSDVLSDFYFVPANNPEEIQAKIIHLITQRIPQRFGVSPIADIQVLTPMRRGGLGSVSLNIALQTHLNPQHDQISKLGSAYGVGDKVIQIVNNYDKEVFNGDIGTITKLDKNEGLLWIQFDERIVEYEFSELDEINLAYAITIHKSQGSEYPVVVLPLAMQHYTLLERNLLYTGVTRAKKLLVLVGESKALGLAIKRMGAQNRLTYLKHFLMSP